MLGWVGGCLCCGDAVVELADHVSLPRCCLLQQQGDRAEKADPLQHSPMVSGSTQRRAFSPQMQHNSTAGLAANTSRPQHILPKYHHTMMTPLP